MPFVLGGGLTDESVWSGFPNLKRWLDETNSRSAAQATLALRERHAFKAEFDEEARRHMFRHLAPAA